MLDNEKTFGLLIFIFDRKTGHYNRKTRCIIGRFETQAEIQQ